MDRLPARHPHRTWAPALPPPCPGRSRPMSPEFSHSSTSEHSPRLPASVHAGRETSSASTSSPGSHCQASHRPDDRGQLSARPALPVPCSPGRPGLLSPAAGPAPSLTGWGSGHTTHLRSSLWAQLPRETAWPASDPGILRERRSHGCLENRPSPALGHLLELKRKSPKSQMAGPTTGTEVPNQRAPRSQG